MQLVSFDLDWWSGKMSEVPALPPPIAEWSTVRCVWETAQEAFCGHLVPFLATFPPSGMMRNGRIYEPQMPEPRTSETESSSSPGRPADVARLLPTPTAGNPNDGESLESWEARRQVNLAKGINGNGQGTPLGIVAQQLLKTPTAQLAVNGGSQHPDKRRAGGHGPTLADQVEHELLPTPTAQLNAHAEWRPGVQWWLQSRAARNLDGVVSGNTGEVSLLPTPVAVDGERRSTTTDRVVDWGKYSRAVLCWQQVMGRMVPFPLVPGSKGNYVLSPFLVEWMMGLPEGWVTAVPGLSRNAQLKILGNGVVPQQAVLAIELLLERVAWNATN